MSIVDKVRELQDEIREKYGVTAIVDINVFDSDNPGMTKELAENICQQLAAQIGVGKAIVEIRRGEKHQWVKLQSVNNFNLTAFYPN